MEVLNQKVIGVCQILVFLFLLVITGTDLYAQQTNESGSEIGKLIEAAHQFDSMYNAGPIANQKLAIDYYQKALLSQPDRDQKLHILYRIGQLYSSGYDIQKGEQPDRQKAISFYKQIVDEYEINDDPVVLAAMCELGSQYSILGRQDEALIWAKRVIEADVSQLANEVERLYDAKYVGEGEGRIAREKRRNLERSLRRTSLLKTSAVDLVVTSASQMEPLRAEAELKTLIQQYPDSLIAERARKRLTQIQSKTEDILLQGLVDSLSSHSLNERLRRAGAESNSLASVNQQPDGSNQGPSSLEMKNTEHSAVQGVGSKPLQTQKPTKSPRDSPFTSFHILMFVILGLTVLSGLVFLKKKLGGKGNER